VTLCLRLYPKQLKDIQRPLVEPRTIIVKF